MLICRLIRRPRSRLPSKWLRFHRQTASRPLNINKGQVELRQLSINQGQAELRRLNISKCPAVRLQLNTSKLSCARKARADAQRCREIG